MGLGLGLGFRVRGCGFRVRVVGLGFGVVSLGFRASFSGISLLPGPLPPRERVSMTGGPKTDPNVLDLVFGNPRVIPMKPWVGPLSVSCSVIPCYSLTPDLP